MNAIEVNGLSKDYGAFKLDHVSFALPGGTIMGLIGENGAGKSTTIKCILNLIRRDAGTVTVYGKDNLREEDAVKSMLGVVLDESHFHDCLTADQAGRIMGGVYRTWDEGLYHSYLKKFELPRNLFFKEFSKGMKAKLSIAAALAHHPRVLILDEATVGLDPVVREEILDEFLSFISDEDHAVLLSSHITSDLEKCADYVTYLHNGVVALSGEKDQLLGRYGRVACTREQLAAVDPSLIVGKRVSGFSCEALTCDRAALKQRYPGLAVDPATLEDIMVFTVRGDKE